jgi:hypothetical protein
VSRAHRALPAVPANTGDKPLSKLSGRKLFWLAPSPRIAPAADLPVGTSNRTYPQGPLALCGEG